MRALETLTSAWLEAELDPAALEPITRAMARRSELTREARAVEVEAEAATAELGRRIAAGELTFAAGLEQHAASTLALDRVGTAVHHRSANVLRAAQGAAVRIALEQLHAAGDVVRVLEDAVADLGAALGKLAPALEDVADAEGAVAAGAKTSGAWRAVQGLEGRRRALAAVWGALARLELVDDKARPTELGGATALVLARRMAEVA